MQERAVVIPVDVWLDGLDEVAGNWSHGGFITRRAFGDPTPTTLPLTIADMQRISMENSRRWFPTLHARGTEANLVHQTLGLGGEAGEVLNLVKKLDAYTAEQQPDGIMDKLRDELADVFTYLLNVAGLVDCDLAAEWERKQAVCEARWGDA